MEEMRMRKIDVLASVAALAVAGIVTQAKAECGKCGPAETEVAKPACKSACTAAAKACAPGCKKSCGGGKAGEACKPGCEKACCAGEIAKLNTSGLKALLGSGVNVTVLDARSGKYYDGRRIPGAASLSPKATAEEAAGAIPSKDALVVTYCSNLKCQASNMLATQLKGLGYKNVIEYPNGIAGWADAGLEVEQSKD
jgi:rhodanese-related sulfurtransferase